MNYVLLPHLDAKHFEFFGIPEGQSMTEDNRFDLFSSLSDEQQNALRRDFLIKHMTSTSGINKKSALLIEFAKYHFPDDFASIEHTHDDEFQKKRQLIQEHLDKLPPKEDVEEDLKEVA